MKLLMHTCCAPCSVYCIDSLRKENIEPVVYWYNPNIHPYMEYKARRDCLKEYTNTIGVEAIFEENYGLQEFCKNVIGDLQNRCKNYCYRVRLEQTAKYAKEHGYDAFTTTLLVSPYQNHESLKEIGEELAKKIQSSLVAHLDPENHRVEKANESYYLLKKTLTPTVIVECGFLSNPFDEANLTDKNYQTKLAYTLFLGIDGFLK